MQVLQWHCPLSLRPRSQLYTIQLHPLQPHNLPLHQRVQPAALQTPHLQHQPHYSPCASVNTADEPCTDAINFVVEVKNTGSTDGNHTVLVYSRPPLEVADAPMKQLVGYLKAFVPGNQSANLTFTINACKALVLVDRTAYVVLPAGNHTIEVGDGPASVSFPLDVMLPVGWHRRSESGEKIGAKKEEERRSRPRKEGGEGGRRCRKERGGDGGQDGGRCRGGGRKGGASVSGKGEEGGGGRRIGGVLRVV